MQKAKKPFILLEILIALFITGIVVELLFSVYKNISIQNVKADPAVETLFKQHTLSIRLQKIFNSLTAPSQETPLYTENKKLFLKWNNGVNINPKISGKVSGILSLQGKNLILIYQKEEEELFQETLLEGIKGVKFFFYDVENKAWVSVWDKKEEALPGLAKVVLEYDQDKTWVIPLFLHEKIL